MSEQVLPWITSTLGDIARFLLARIAEDEAACAVATTGPWATQTMAGNLVYGDPLRGTFVCDTGSGSEDVLDDADHIARWNPARVVAECRFKRAQIRHVTAFRDASDVPLREMALLYAKHPDYRRDDWAIIHMGDQIDDDEWWLAR